MADKIFGIDLGTTYSCISYVDSRGIATVLPNLEGQNTTPSVVYFESPTNIAVGQSAKDSALVHPSRVVEAIRRAMGDASYTFEVDDRKYRPEEISAFILRKVVEDAEKIIGEKITDVVITCPAYFDANQREATRQAAVLAGLNVRYVIPEPTAAAMAYGMDGTEDEVTLVYDLGGGTFDVTLIAISRDALKVICTDGDHQLGGKDWDGKIVSYFAEEFQSKTGSPSSEITDDLEAYQELVSKAERAKIQLSTKQSVTIPLTAGGERIAVHLTREKFDELTQPLLNKTINLMRAARKVAAEAGFAKINKILMVGGSSYMPQVRAQIEKEFSGDIALQDPNLIVAKGAAMFGHKLLLKVHIKEGIAHRLNIDTDMADAAHVDPRVRIAAIQEAAVRAGITTDPAEKIIDKTNPLRSRNPLDVIGASPGDLSDAALRERIKETRLQATRDRAHPTRHNEAYLILELAAENGEFERRLFQDPQGRQLIEREFRAWYAEQQRKARETVAEQIKFLKAHGDYTKDDIKRLLTLTEGMLTEPEIESFLRGAGLNPEHKTPATDEGLDRSTARSIAQHLVMAEEESLYSVLGIKSQTSNQEALRLMDEIHQNLRHRTDKKSLAKRELLGHIATIFSSEEQRSRYNTTLSWSKLDRFGLVIDTAARNNFLSTDAFIALVRDAVRLGAEQKAADSFIKDHCKRRKITIQQDSSREKPPRRDRTKIFISYRRTDSGHIAGRIYDRLRSEFGEAQIFFDVDNIPLGADFRSHIRQSIDDSAVAIAIVGAAWVNRDWTKRRWIFNFGAQSEDFVRTEIELALELGVSILPVLVDNTAMPAMDVLPRSLHPFTFRNASPVRAGRDFHADMERILKMIREQLSDMPQSKDAVPDQPKV